MADYYSLIKKAIARLNPDAPFESRRALYERARVAQLTQLRSISPSLTEAEIACEQQALEKAIARLEAEAAQIGNIRVPILDDLVIAADNIGKPLTRAVGPCVIQAKAHASLPDQTTTELPLAMFVTGGATARLIRYWRWRSLPPRRVA